MRLLAKKAKIATGTVYNYFSSKDEIFLTLTEKYRHKIIEKIKVNSSSDCFYEHLRETFEFLNEQIEKSAGKLMTNLGKMESIGQRDLSKVFQTFISCRNILTPFARWTALAKNPWPIWLRQLKRAAGLNRRICSLLCAFQ